jgi:predicted nucleic acid-binding protein
VDDSADRILKVVSNAGPLITLSVIGQFDLLAKLFGGISIPAAVYDERSSVSRRVVQGE